MSTEPRGTKRRVEDLESRERDLDPEAPLEEEDDQDTRPTKFTRASEPEREAGDPSPNITPSRVAGTESEAVKSSENGPENESQELGSANAVENDEDLKPTFDRAPVSPETTGAPSTAALEIKSTTSDVGALSGEQDRGESQLAIVKEDTTKDVVSKEPLLATDSKSTKALSMFGAGKKGNDEPEDGEDDSPPRPPTNKNVTGLGSTHTPAMSPLAKSMNSKLSTTDSALSTTSLGTSVSSSQQFGSTKSTFGSFKGTVFGAGSSGVSFDSFANAGGSGNDFASLLSRPNKAKTKDDDDDSGGEGSSGEEPKEKEFDPEDYKPKILLEPREVVTGEEGEETVAQIRGKLFDFDENKGPKGDWKERGVGLLRLNKKPGQESARLVMRMDGVYRVILNVSLFKNMTCSLVQEKFLRFIASETPGKLTTFLLKTSNPTGAAAMAKQINTFANG